MTVRRDDLALLLYGFDHPEATALGSRPIARLRAALDGPDPQNFLADLDEPKFDRLA